jgi:hypothetical protein
VVVLREEADSSCLASLARRNDKGLGDLETAARSQAGGFRKFVERTPCGSMSDR